MKSISLQKYRALAIFIAGLLALGPALADPPPWAGNNKGKEHKDNYDRNDSRDRHDTRSDGRGDEHHDRKDVRTREYFDSYHREVVSHYYQEQYRHGKCPPGLAKKHNGCLPPGQARKWSVGQPLPSDVRRYDVPRSLVVEIGTPPPGYRYVRVASDILLIAVGSGMVVDAIQDLGRH